MPWYIRKPVKMFAALWNGDLKALREAFHLEPDDARLSIVWGPEPGDGLRLEVVTLEGTIYADYGDMIVRGVEGELWPVKPSIFKKTYELIEDPPDENRN